LVEEEQNNIQDKDIATLTTALKGLKDIV